MTKNKVFLFGLDNGGKTSIVNSIKNLPEPGDTSPTVKFNISDMIIEDTDFVIWDAPGQTLYREKWGKGVLESEILCFVIDLFAPNRFKEAKEELYKMLDNPEIREVPLILCYNKIDLMGAKGNIPKLKEIIKPEYIRNRPVHELETSIMSPDSILKLKKLFVDLIQEARW